LHLLELELRKCSVPPDQLEALAADREAWRDVCEEGLAAFDVNYNQELGRSSSRPSTRGHKHTCLWTTLHCTSVTAESAHLSPGCGVIPASRASSSLATDSSKQLASKQHVLAKCHQAKRSGSWVINSALDFGQL